MAIYELGTTAEREKTMYRGHAKLHGYLNSLLSDDPATTECETRSDLLLTDAKIHEEWCRAIRQINWLLNGHNMRQ